MELQESRQYNPQFTYNAQNYPTPYNYTNQSSSPLPQSQYYNTSYQNYYPNTNGFLSPSDLSPTNTYTNNYNNLTVTNTVTHAAYYNYACPSNTTQFQNSFTSSVNNDSAYQSQSEIISPNVDSTFDEFNASKFVSTPVNVERALNKKRKRQSESDTDSVEQVSPLSPFSVNETLVEVKSKRPKVLKLNFASSINMVNGVTTDSSESESLCTICNMSFFSTAKLLMHHHKVHKNGSSTQCPICLKKFGNHANTLVHLRAHTQEKTYKCHICTQAFCDASTLKKHLRVHSGEKPYACSICEKRFTQSGNLKRHVVVHQKYNDQSETSLENKINYYEPTALPIKQEFQFDHTIKNEYNFANTQLIASNGTETQYIGSCFSQPSQYPPNTSSYAYETSY